MFFYNYKSLKDKKKDYYRLNNFIFFIALIKKKNFLTIYYDFIFFPIIDNEKKIEINCFKIFQK